MKTTIRPPAQNKIATLIRQKENNAFRFNPNEDFFREIGIGKKRFHAILRNEVAVDLAELAAIAEYFSVDLKELF